MLTDFHGGEAKQMKNGRLKKNEIFSKKIILFHPDENKSIFIESKFS
jgi:hypothetical protein